MRSRPRVGPPARIWTTPAPKPTSTPICRRTCRSSGHRPSYVVIEACDGVEALRQIENLRNIRLLLTDLELPGEFNGRQLADRALSLRPEPKVLFTTGYARGAIVHQGRLEPGVQLISKPFTPAAPASKVRQLLDG